MKTQKEESTKTVKKVAPKAPGIIDTIATAIEKSGSKGISKEEIHKILVKTFPDRSPESMRNTINVQVPTNITKQRFPVIRMNGDGVSRYIKAKA